MDKIDVPGDFDVFAHLASWKKNKQPVLEANLGHKRPLQHYNVDLEDFIHGGDTAVEEIRLADFRNIEGVRTLMILSMKNVSLGDSPSPRATRPRLHLRVLPRLGHLLQEVEEAQARRCSLGLMRHR